MNYNSLMIWSRRMKAGWSVSRRQKWEQFRAKFMIKSMTGFGQGTAEGDTFKVRVDIRSVNNRFLDVHMRLPQELASMELTLKKQVQAALHRGRVDVTISIEQMRQASFE